MCIKQNTFPNYKFETLKVEVLGKIQGRGYFLCLSCFWCFSSFACSKCFRCFRSFFTPFVQILPTWSIEWQMSSLNLLLAVFCNLCWLWLTAELQQTTTDLSGAQMETKENGTCQKTWQKLSQLSLWVLSLLNLDGIVRGMQSVQSAPIFISWKFSRLCFPLLKLVKYFCLTCA